MKAKLLVLLILPLFWNCKEKKEAAPPQIQERIEQQEDITRLPPIIKELAKFVEPTFTDAMNIDELMIFKELNASGKVTAITMDKAVDLYKKINTRSEVTPLPIFEIKNTETAILPIQGIGFGGAIWAKVLVDRKTMEIKKVAFEHKAESDGYGAAMTRSSFEDQFVGTKINLEQNTYSLQKAVDNGRIINGISGSTITSKGVVEMMNEGLRKYRSYLEGE